MELPPRAAGDELLRPGEHLRLRERLRKIARRHDVTSVITCAFDHRTRMLPFFYAATRMAPAGVRAIGSAMVDSGFEKTRIVLQQWNRNFRPSQMRLDGRVPDLFMVSSMQIHAAATETLIRDACRIDPDHRPLIVVGGPKTIYEPWDVFSADRRDPWAADVAVTGEEHVLLSLLEVLLSTRAKDESLRKTFMRARDSGILDDIPGLVYARTDGAGAIAELVDTGVQRLLGMSSLAHTIRPTLGWAVRLWRGNIRRKTAPPTSRIPMRGVNGAAADHALPVTPRAKRGVRGQSTATVSQDSGATSHTSKAAAAATTGISPRLRLTRFRTLGT